METCNLSQRPLTKTLPFGPLIALLGTCPKGMAGNGGRGRGEHNAGAGPTERLVEWKEMRSWTRAAPATPGRETVAASPGVEHNGLVYVLMLCGQTGPRGLSLPCPRSLWGPQGCFLLPVTFPRVSNFSITEKTF